MLWVKYRILPAILGAGLQNLALCAGTQKSGIVWLALHRTPCPFGMFIGTYIPPSSHPSRRTWSGFTGPRFMRRHPKIRNCVARPAQNSLSFWDIHRYVYTSIFTPFPPYLEQVYRTSLRAPAPKIWNCAARPAQNPLPFWDIHRYVYTS